MIILSPKDIADINHDMLLYWFCMMRYKWRTFDIIWIEEILEDFKSLRDKKRLEERIKQLEEIVQQEKLFKK